LGKNLISIREKISFFPVVFPNKTNGKDNFPTGVTSLMTIIRLSFVIILNTFGIGGRVGNLLKGIQIGGDD
jgi:hypothetical protein